jgi:hypothetical protein
MKLRGKAKEEFLRRMARGRRAKAKRHHHKKRRERVTITSGRNRGKSYAVGTPALKRELRNSRRRHTQHKTTMAKKKRKSSHHRKSRKGHHRRGHHRHHGGLFGASGAGLRSRWIPTGEEAIAAGTAGLYGYLEAAASKDKEHILAKMPVPIASLGRSGTVAGGLWLLGALTRRRFVRCMARGALDVTAYQMFRRGQMFGKGGDQDVDFNIAGLRRQPIDTRTPAMIEAHLAQLDDDDDDA